MSSDDFISKSMYIVKPQELFKTLNKPDYKSDTSVYTLTDDYTEKEKAALGLSEF